MLAAAFKIVNDVDDTDVFCDVEILMLPFLGVYFLLVVFAFQLLNLLKTSV